MRDVESFYVRYLREEKIPRSPQTQPMGMGSAFDGFVKAYIFKCIHGKYDDTYNPENLFETQVEPHNRDYCWEHGLRLFEAYKKAGCCADLMLEVNSAIGVPQFEFTIKDTIEGVPLLGKPDMYFFSKEGTRIIYDWKVNGYCAKSLKSPMKGYVKLREEGKLEKIHKDAVVTDFGGVKINAAMYLEEGSKDWADQLAVYSWLLGEEIGSESFVAGIDQICGPKDRLRFATHRCRVSSGWQRGFMDVAKDCWETINSDHIFRHLSKEDSQAQCQLLDMMDPEDLINEDGFF